MDYSRTFGAGAAAPQDNLVIDLDAGNIDSYDGSSQFWNNLVAKDVIANIRPIASMNYFRGSGSGSDALDPTFNGVAGDLSSSEFWSFDGGDIFVMDVDGIDTGTINIPNWWQDWHQDSADFTIVVWADVGTLALNPLFSASGPAAGGNEAGVIFHQTLAGELSLQVRHNSSGDALALVTSSGLGIATDDIGMMAISVDEAAGAAGSLFFWNDGTKVTDTFDATYTAPGGVSSTIPRIAADVSGGNKVSSTFNLFAVRAYNKSLSEAELDTEFDRLKGRFGL